VEVGESSIEQVRQVVGVWRSPAEFVEAALEVQHPIDSSGILDPILCEALKFVVETDPAEVAKHQLHTIRRLVKLIEDHKQEEECLHSKLDTAAKHILKNKNLLVLKLLLQEIAWKDHSLVDDVISGFAITGQKGFSGKFIEDPKFPSINETVL
jgi:hypothetical protein